MQVLSVAITSRSQVWNFTLHGLIYIHQPRQDGVDMFVSMGIITELWAVPIWQRNGVHAARNHSDVIGNWCGWFLLDIPTDHCNPI
jgi:hypothetical protein